MQQSHCAHCGQENPPSSRRPRKYCSKRCSMAVYREYAEVHGKRCAQDECDRPRVAHGLCSTHYNRTLGEKRHRKVEMPCGACGAMVLKDPSNAQRYANVYCSYACRDAHVHAEARATRRQVVPYRGRSALGMYLAAYESPAKRRPRTWVAGTCRVCGSGYLCKYGSSTCGDRCQAEWWATVERAAEQRRRARKRDAFVANVYRTEIYRRDNNTCQLCGSAMEMGERAPHPLAPTIDHVIPLANGGTHEPANTQAAHFICNSIKSDLRSVPMLF